MWDYMDSRPPGVNTIPEYPGWNGAMRQRGEYRVRKGRRERQCVVTERACELAADRVQVCLWK